MPFNDQDVSYSVTNTSESNTSRLRTVILFDYLTLWPWRWTFK